MDSDNDEESSDSDNYYRVGLISKVAENLYVTDFCGANNEDALRKLGIFRVISIGDWSEQMCYKKFEGIEYLPVVIDDSEHEDISIYFNSTNGFISNSPGPVLVHCWAGISRSPTIVIAHFIVSKGKSYLGAFLQIQKVRPFIKPNIGFIDVLGKLESKK